MDEELDTQSQDSIGEVVDTAKNVAGKAKQTTGKVANAAKKAGKAIGKAGKAVNKAAVKIFSNPLFWKVILIGGVILLVVLMFALIISAIGSALASFFGSTDFDPNTGLLSSKYGITGDRFYGARFVYQDDETANLEIQEDYLLLTNSILNDTQSETGLTISLAAEYANDEKVLEITTDYANALIKNTNAELTLEECIEKIDHFGFTDSEITIVFDSIANTLKNNSSQDEWATASIENIKTALNTEYQTDTYKVYKNVTPKIYVWDYILENEEDGLKNLPKKDYYGYIPMPKEVVTITSMSFVFIVDNANGVDVRLKQKLNNEVIDLGEVASANDSWYKDNQIEEIYESDTEVEIAAYTAIDTNNTSALQTPTSIYDLLGNDKFSIYFNDVEDYDGLTLIKNVASSNYMYLELDNKDEDKSPFNFSEFYMEYA